ncbi:uncharacterized protein LOC110194581 isoform X2 [Phascolarctos cinereus]|uniref:Uncharacterized protein LOC110194581 isoform X2 n=1 Tax=Phascolarctos cinereus TaxID=38626 RepID=A0A6P5IKL5_PHACI|nr:uncharacterized protein LOC110194581 isoform X2 [Phascolarctos cinereus]XP_020822657.1 uncharacterized protein LOC110194581 isoform X2 [Phascolarctos cinereus]XP_020822658.1 uncharacterized protein LOC110194581 isoform X2 [Phascolarctos cinereus]
MRDPWGEESGSRKSSPSTMNTTDKENSSDLTEIEDTSEIIESSKTEDIADATQNVVNAEKNSFFCPLSKLLLSADALIKENEKIHNLRKHDISITEAKNYLLQVLNIISLETLSHRVPTEFAQPIAFKGKCHISDPKEMIKILHRTLLAINGPGTLTENRSMPSRAIALMNKISLPMHIFPYEMLAHHCLPFLLPFLIRDDILNEKIFCRIVLFNIVLPKGKVFRPQAKRQKHYEKLLHPEKQFMDLKDLQRKYYKGILKWKRKSRMLFKDPSFVIEKAFVPEMISLDYKPTVIFKLVRSTDFNSP